jgi:hypothetical protein
MKHVQKHFTVQGVEYLENTDMLACLLACKNCSRQLLMMQLCAAAHATPAWRTYRCKQAARSRCKLEASVGENAKGERGVPFLLPGLLAGQNLNAIAVLGDRTSVALTSKHRHNGSLRRPIPLS